MRKVRPYLIAACVGCLFVLAVFAASAHAKPQPRGVGRSEWGVVRWYRAHGYLVYVKGVWSKARPYTVTRIDLPAKGHRTVCVRSSRGLKPKRPRYHWSTAVSSVYGGPSERQAVAGPYPNTGYLDEHPDHPAHFYFAHKHMAFRTRVLFRHGGREQIGVCVDRGPYVEGRTFDLGVPLARKLGVDGVDVVEYTVLK